MKWILSMMLMGLCNVGFSQVIPSVKVEELVAKYNNASGIIVVNFWSTWCKPCIEEMPHFLSVTDSLKPAGVHLLLVSLDSKEVFATGRLQAFVTKKKWDASIVWLNETNADHYCPVIAPQWSGVLPVTLIVNASKKYQKFYESGLTKQDLIHAIKEAM